MMLTAVRMHPDETQRRAGITRLAVPVTCHGLLGMALRHGPIPAGRRMFDVTAEETVAPAKTHDLECIWRTEHGNGRVARPGVRRTGWCFVGG